MCARGYQVSVIHLFVGQKQAKGICRGFWPQAENCRLLLMFRYVCSLTYAAKTMLKCMLYTGSDVYYPAYLRCRWGHRPRCRKVGEKLQCRKHTRGYIRRKAFLVRRRMASVYVAPRHIIERPDLICDPGPVSYTHLTLPTIYSV